MTDERTSEKNSGSEKYFLRSRGRIMGPLELDRILELRARGRVSGADEISTDRRTWQKIADVERSRPAKTKTVRSGGGPATDEGYAIVEQSAEAPQPQPPPEEPSWFCYAGDEQLGPFSTESLLSKLRSGALPPDVLVWKQGMNDWVAVDEVPELQAVRQRRPKVGRGASETATLTYAGFWKRVIAYFIDQFIISLFLGLFCMPILFALFRDDTLSSEAGAFLYGATYFWITVLIRSPIAWIYYAAMEGAAVQGTLGKMALGIKVTDEGGRPITFVRALGRNFCKSLSGVVFGLGYLAAAFTQRKQALHDLMTGCLVVEREST